MSQMTMMMMGLHILLTGDGQIAPIERNALSLWPAADGSFALTPPTSIAVASASPTVAALRGAPRAYLLLGEGATLRGLAGVLRPVLYQASSLDVTSPIISSSLAALGAALYRVATEVTFGTSAAPTSVELDANWTVGTLFPLPLWATDGGNTRSWQVDAPRLLAALTAVTADEQNQAARAARSLEQFDPANLRTDFDAKQPYLSTTAARKGLTDRLAAALAVSGAKPADVATAEGTAQGVAARWNPYSGFLVRLETSLYCDSLDATTQAIYRPAYAAAFWAALTTPERAAFGETSAGHVWLRRMWSWWGMGGAIADLKALLALQDDDLTVRAPGRVGVLEPPLFERSTPIPTVSANLPKKAQLPVMAFGRRVPFIKSGDVEGSTHWVGVASQGAVDVLPFFQNPTWNLVSAGVVPGSTAAQQADLFQHWGRVISALSAAEARMDGATTCDGGIVSLGFQQWSMHSPTQGPALLEHLKFVSPVYYDAIVRALGIETGLKTDSAPNALGADAQHLYKDSQFFKLTSSEAPAAIYPDGKNDDPANHQVAAKIFDWTVTGVRTPGGSAIRFAARWAILARFTPALWTSMIDLGLARIPVAAQHITTNVTKASSPWAGVLNVPTTPFSALADADRVFTIYGTDALQAAIVDLDINTPGYVDTTMRRALVIAMAVASQEGITSAKSSANPPSLSQEFALLLLKTFLAERIYTSKGNIADGPVSTGAARSFMTSRATGHLQDTSSVSLPAALATMLKAYGVDRVRPLGLFDPAVWKVAT